MTAVATCGRCGGNGQLRVLDGYVDRLAPWPEAPGLGCTPLEHDAHELLVARVAERRAAYADTWYPCKDCNPKAFFRWARGCYTDGHDRASCDLCIEAGTHRGRGGSSYRDRGPRDVPNEPPEPVHRRDLDGPDEPAPARTTPEF